MRKFGRPHYIVTFTCNPRWTEIMRELREGQQPCDRPDLVVWVFHMKLHQLIYDLTKKEFFGRVPVRLPAACLRCSHVAPLCTCAHVCCAGRHGCTSSSSRSVASSMPICF